MPFIADAIFDNGLSHAQSNITRTDICSQEPTTYTEATSTYSLGNKTGLTCGAPEDGAVDGRRVVVPAITDGSVTADGTASHYAENDGASFLASAGGLSASQSVTNGNTFSLDAVSITMRDAA